MSSHQQAKPKWWQLYLTFPLLIALFALESRLHISASGHEITQLCILLLVYGLIHVWIKANLGLSAQINQKRPSTTITIISIDPSWSSSDASRPGFILPNSEIKGVLSNTFEHDSMDDAPITMQEEKQQANKE